MSEVSKDKLKRAEKFISEKCQNATTFPSLISKFIKEGIEKNMEEACILVAKVAKVIIKDAVYDPIQKYFVLQQVKEGMNVMNPIFVKHVRKELLDDQKKLAEFEKRKTSIDRGRNLFDKLCKKNPNQAYSQKFFTQLLECLSLWSHVIPSTCESKPFTEAFKKQKDKEKVTFPLEVDVTEYFLEFKKSSNKNQDTPGPKLPHINDILHNIENIKEHRVNLKSFVETSDTLTDYIDSLIKDYNHYYKIFEPTNNILLTNEDRKYDVARELGTAEMCFYSDFTDMVTKSLYNDGNYYAFKIKFMQIYKTLFPNEMSSSNVFHNPNGSQVNKRFDSELKNLKYMDNSDILSRAGSHISGKRSVRDMINHLDNNKRVNKGHSQYHNNDKYSSRGSNISVTELDELNKSKKKFGTVRNDNFKSFASNYDAEDVNFGINDYRQGSSPKLKRQMTYESNNSVGKALFRKQNTVEFGEKDMFDNENLSIHSKSPVRGRQNNYEDNYQSKNKNSNKLMRSRIEDKRISEEEEEMLNTESMRRLYPNRETKPKNNNMMMQEVNLSPNKNIYNPDQLLKNHEYLDKEFQSLVQMKEEQFNKIKVLKNTVENQNIEIQKLKRENERLRTQSKYAEKENMKHLSKQENEQHSTNDMSLKVHELARLVTQKSATIESLNNEVAEFYEQKKYDKKQTSEKLLDLEAQIENERQMHNKEIIKQQQRLKNATNQANIWKGEMSKFIHDSANKENNVSIDPQDINLADKFSHVSDICFSNRKKPSSNPYKIDTDLAAKLSGTNYPYNTHFNANFNDLDFQSRRSSTMKTEPAENFAHMDNRFNQSFQDYGGPILSDPNYYRNETPDRKSSFASLENFGQSPVLPIPFMKNSVQGQNRMDGRVDDATFGVNTLSAKLNNLRTNINTNKISNATGTMSDRLNPLPLAPNGPVDMFQPMTSNNSQYSTPRLIENNYQSTNLKTSNFIPSSGEPINNFRASINIGDNYPISTNNQILSATKQKLLYLDHQHLPFNANMNHLQKNRPTHNPQGYTQNNNYLKSNSKIFEAKNSNNFLGDFNSKLNNIMNRSQYM